MIPVKIELYNFLAYHKPQLLDLTGVHVACLAGANGAGKSSLLDAITWSLWGKARVAHDDLVHGNEEEMYVELTFAMHDDLYRVKRWRSRKGRGRSELLLSIQDGDGRWRDLSEQNIRVTEQKIRNILNLDYDTFINSSFLMQGRADEFTQKTPAERKVILSEILGLKAWEDYEARAKQRLKELEGEKRQIDAQLRDIQEELAREQQYKDELIATQREVESITQQVAAAQERFQALDYARREREAKEQHHRTLASRVNSNRAELDRLLAERAKVDGRLTDVRELLEASDEIQHGYETLQAALRHERDLSDMLREQAVLRDRQVLLQRHISAARAELNAQQREFQTRVASLEEAIRDGTEARNLAEVEQDIQALQEMEQKVTVWRQEVATFREQRADLDATNRALRGEMDVLKSRRDQLLAATEPVCPLCGQDLTDHDREGLIEHLSDEGTTKADTYRTNRSTISDLSAQIETLEGQVQSVEGDLRRLPALQQHAATLSERINRANQAMVEYETAQAGLEEVSAKLGEGWYAEAEQAELAEVETKLEQLGYDDLAHEEARRTIEQNRQFELRKAELEKARERVQELEENRASLDTRVAEWEAHLAEDDRLLTALRAELDELDSMLVDYDRCEQELAFLREEEARARYKVGAADQRLKALEQQRNRRSELRERLDGLAEEQGIYEELRQAFSKNGVPAMIIETAIPEIQNEANQILARMTDGRMHIRFDTQRDNKSGGTRETLDILIADELGTRNYDSFSGGESFRINFAVRLALSRMLARRAGAQLRTLIIDEGFGSQDVQGRERLIQAINQIQNDFDRVLVITHIDELKEAFPVRIEVTKTPDGSVIDLV
ncbi:MAG: SMC family ATPase [Chloroflexi bacterium]|nr:SMC family ATPase [Chloroflexota bacterium]